MLVTSNDIHREFVFTSRQFRNQLRELSVTQLVRAVPCLDKSIDGIFTICVVCTLIADVGGLLRLAYEGAGPTADIASAEVGVHKAACEVGWMFLRCGGSKIFNTLVTYRLNGSLQLCISAAGIVINSCLSIQVNLAASFGHQVFNRSLQLLCNEVSEELLIFFRTYNSPVSAIYCLRTHLA